MKLESKLRSPKEPTLFVLGVIFSALVWLVLVLITLGIGLVYIGVFALFVYITHSLFLAQVRGNGIRLSPNQLPELYGRTEAAARRLGLEKVPEVYLVQSGGLLNAFATKLFSHRFVVLYSALVDACEDPRQLDFVIAHEVGHLAAGHLAWQSFLTPFRALPWLGAAYSRACEYTCDRCGHAFVGELEPSMRALVVLAGGGKLSSRVNLDEFEAQRWETGRFWMAVRELVSSHPYLCKRMAAIRELAAPGTVKEIGRNPLAYPLAPFLGIGGVGAGAGLGGMVVAVAIIGVLAAIAVPNFIAYQKKAQASALRHQQAIERSSRYSNPSNDATDPTAWVRTANGTTGR